MNEPLYAVHDRENGVSAYVYKVATGFSVVQRDEDAQETVSVRTFHDETPDRAKAYADTLTHDPK